MTSSHVNKSIITSRPTTTTTTITTTMHLTALILEPLQFLLELTPLRGSTDHFQPHAGVPFEGYYTRIQLSTGATVVLIFSSVFGAAPAHRHFLHFSYHPSNATSKRIVVNKFPATITDVLAEDSRGFCRIATGDGVDSTFLVSPEAQSYRLILNTDEGKFDIYVDLSSRTPWTPGDCLSGPEGALAALVNVLPLHWHVFSTSSRAVVTINGSNLSSEQELEEAVGFAHMEKNWGNSFPAGWTWLQGFASGGTKSFCLAGGKLCGQKAFLLQYRTENRVWSWGPPWTIMPAGFATPWMREWVDSRLGRARFEMQDWVRGRRLLVEVQASEEHKGWLPVPCPLSDGHGNRFAYETFEGVVRVAAFERPWPWSEWKLVEETVFERAAVEFGGDYSFKVAEGRA
jgi:tocopherol cyclase